MHLPALLAHPGQVLPIHKRTCAFEVLLRRLIGQRVHRGQVAGAGRLEPRHQTALQELIRRQQRFADHAVVIERLAEKLPCITCQVCLATLAERGRRTDAAEMLLGGLAHAP